MEVNLAKKLLEKYGGEVDDYFKLWPPDKHYMFSPDKKAFLAYAIKFRVAVCLFDPIGPYDSVKVLLNQFERYCKRKHLKPIFIQTTDKYDDLYKSTGLKRLLIGSDAVIDNKKFLKSTIHNKYFRNINNRFTKLNYKVVKSRPPHSSGLLNELNEVSVDWLKLPNHKEWLFLTGRFSPDYLNDLAIYILRDDKGRAIAFSNELPTYRKGMGSVDLIRRRRRSLPNSTDFLFIGIIRHLNKKGYDSFNIGMSPIDGRHFAKKTSEKLLVGLYETSQSVVGFKGLHQFKSKYEPSWEPRYVYYKGSVLRLVHMGIAIYKLMV